MSENSTDRHAGGLTVLLVIARKAAPVTDLGQVTGNIFGWFADFSSLKD
jgi:hypothetical protein